MNKAKLIKYLKYIIVNILMAALISILMIRYVVSAYKIEGSSMNSVLKNQERIIISKLAVKNENINRFDIVVLRKPGNPNSSIIKRVIGLPGEVIEIKKGDVYIDSEKLPQPFLEKEKKFDGIHMNPLLIRRGHYFVIGDNRRFSRDSRYFGEVPGKDILGKAVFRYWPLSRFGKIE